MQQQRHRSLTVLSTLTLSLLFSLSGCSGSEASAGGVAGSTGLNGIGGATGISAVGGNVAAGGKVGTGGATATGAATTGNGGTANAATTVAVLGGGSGTGGATATGAGGTPAKGGASSTKGGSNSTGSGGVTAKGGGSAKGGTMGAGGATAKGGSTGASTSTHTGVWRITPLGDSITGTTCYPQLLAQTLENGAHKNFAMVGSNTNNQDCSAPTQKTEGHGGYLVTYLTTDNPPQSGKGTLTELNSWTNTATDVLLIHFGTNDVWSNVAPATILSAYEFAIGKYRAKNANLVVFVSKIVSMNPSGCSDCATRVANLDALITSLWATTNSTATSPVYIIDHSTAIVPASDTADGVHPNKTGAQKMATITYDALISGKLPGI